MAGRYNRSKKGRSHGKYRARLQGRGINHAPTMISLQQLRKEQGRNKGDADDKDLEAMLDGLDV